METELQADIKAPFRTQPRVAQAGSALVAAGVLLITVVMPLHLIGFVAFPSAANGPVALWQRLLPAAFLALFLAFGVWMAQSLIRLGYELARPKMAILFIAAVALAVQAITALAGCSMTLLFVELIGIPVCLIAGFIVYSAGIEIAAIANCQGAGGGLGALAGMVWGYLYTETQLATVGCMLVGGLAAEGLGRTIRMAIRYVRKRAEARRDDAIAKDHTHAA